MIKYILLIAGLFSLGQAHGQNVCDVIAGATLVADDGTLLGRLTNSYSSDSILNEYGTHGSQYSSKSIWNQYGAYGGQYSSQSPFNPNTSTPPLLIKDGQIIARVTVNNSVSGALNPYIVKTCTF